MYLARSASFRSGDLAREVGAAMWGASGEIIFLGWKEVAKYGGGNYWCDDEGDARDFALGEDPNDRIKRELLYDILDVLFKAGNLSEDLTRLGTTKDVMASLMRGKTGLRDSKVMDILEFGRVIHAEMSAMSDAARFGLSVKGGGLYSYRYRDFF